MNVEHAKQALSRIRKQVGKGDLPSQSLKQGLFGNAEEFNIVDPESKNGVFLTVKQVCRMFDVTPMTINNWRRSKAFPYVKCGSGAKPPVRYDEGACLHWAALTATPIAFDDYLESRYE